MQWCIGTGTVRYGIPVVKISAILGGTHVPVVKMKTENEKIGNFVSPMQFPKIHSTNFFRNHEQLKPN